VSELAALRSSSPEWAGVPVFGSRAPGRDYRVRPSAYGFVADGRGRLAIVRSADGCFLPGGGIESGETPEQAVVREALEECGLLLRVGACVARAVEFAYSEEARKHQEKLCWFFAVTVAGRCPEAQLPGHEVLWLAAADGARTLLHESQRWAVSEWSAWSTRARG
jgi:8-oxo-dGTP diphosphatase